MEVFGDRTEQKTRGSTPGESQTWATVGSATETISSMNWRNNSIWFLPDLITVILFLVNHSDTSLGHEEVCIYRLWCLKLKTADLSCILNLTYKVCFIENAYFLGQFPDCDFLPSCWQEMYNVTSPSTKWKICWKIFHRGGLFCRVWV